MDMDTDKIIAKLKPDEKILGQIDDFVKEVNQCLVGLKAKCVKGGSIAKGTFLPEHDADLFVRFNQSYRGKPISDLLEKAIKKLQPIRVHGSRDYFQVKKGITYEIVPVLEVKDYRQAENVTDMSPLHVDYVVKKLKKGQQDQIRLAKQFCKSAKVYGAESYIQGFSGHVIDLLIINYGTFDKLVKAASKWKKKTVIDLEKHHKDPLTDLDNSKTYSPLVIVDPIQPDRNAAAALSKEKYELFINRCKDYLDKPSESFFKVKPFNTTRKGYYIHIKPLEGKKDVIGAKVMKIYEFIKTELQKHDFKLKDSEWEFGNPSILYFKLEKTELPKEKEIIGPPLLKLEDCQRFEEKYSKVTKDKHRLRAITKREYPTASKLIKDLLKNRYVVNRSKSASFKDKN